MFETKNIKSRFIKKLLATPLVTIVAFVLLGAGVTFGTIYLGGSGRTGETSLQKGLVAHWSLDGNAKDSTPYANDGTISGATSTTDRKGQTDAALNFNGVDNYVDCGNSASLKNMGSAVTVAAWAKYNAYGGGGQSYSVIVVKGSPWTFLLENPSNKIRFRVTAGGVDANAQDSVAHELNRWYHFVGTYDGENIRIYKDGVQVGITPRTGALGVNDITAKIGTYQGTNYNFNGTLDDVRIYNRALSGDEIIALYESYQ